MAPPPAARMLCRLIADARAPRVGGARGAGARRSTAPCAPARTGCPTGVVRDRTLEDRIEVIPREQATAAADDRQPRRLGRRERLQARHEPLGLLWPVEADERLDQIGRRRDEELAVPERRVPVRPAQHIDRLVEPPVAEREQGERPLGREAVHAELELVREPDRLAPRGPGRRRLTRVPLDCREHVPRGRSGPSLPECPGELDPPRTPPLTRRSTGRSRAGCCTTRRRASGKPGVLSRAPATAALPNRRHASYSPRIQCARPAQMRSRADRSPIPSSSSSRMAARA